jgi:hypothetical protein
MQTFLTLKWNHIENLVMVPRGSAGSIPLATEKGYREGLSSPCGIRLTFGGDTGGGKPNN